MITEQTLIEFGFVKEEDYSHLKEMIINRNKKPKNKARLKEVYVEIYPENPLVSSDQFMLLLRTCENNATVSVDDDRLVLRRNDKNGTHFVNVLIPKITECFSKISESYFEFILNVQNVYYRISIFN